MVIRSLAVEGRGFHKHERVQLRPRDIEILEFANDMKFISAREVHDRFFMSKYEKSPRATSAAINRMVSLKAAGYVESCRSHMMPAVFYRVTTKGVRALEIFKPMREHCPALGSLDQNTMDHDYRVLQTRVFLEKHNAVTAWVSERQLRTEPSVARGLKPEFHPDGIMVMPSGERVAFEFENARKSREVYRTKIEKFVDFMRAEGEKSFTKINFVCVRAEVASALRDLTRQYGEEFQVDLIPEFIDRHFVTEEELKSKGKEMLQKGLLH